VIFLFFLEIQLDITEGNSIMDHKLALGSLVITVIYVFFIINPFHFFVRILRVGILHVLGENILAPFKKVEVKHFMVGNTLISLIPTIRDFGTTITFLVTGNWLTSTAIDINDYPALFWFTCICGYVLIQIRFLQCCSKYFEKKEVRHKINATKYTVVACAQVTYVLYMYFYNDSETYKWIYIGVSLFAFCCSFSWDTYFDWGLLRSREKGKWMLRPKIMFPAHTYYFAVVTNGLMRLVWITYFFREHLPWILKDKEWHILFMSVVEILRRA
jgi:hypothetical protein